MSGIWIIAENHGATLELLNIGRQLAEKMNTGISVFLPTVRERASEYLAFGAREVVILAPLLEDAPFDSFIPLIADEAKIKDPDLILISLTARGKDLAARIAARLDTGLCSGCIALRFDQQRKELIMGRLVYGGRALQEVICCSRPAMATIAPRTFDKAAPLEKPLEQGVIRELAPSPVSKVKVLKKKPNVQETRDIFEARVVVCIGRGVEKSEHISLARELAKALDGEIGCTRPISEELRWLPESLCIRLSGIKVKPDLYLSLGVSGQIQHVIGIRNAKVIAAVNKEENAPIFRVADLGIVADLYEIVPKIIAELKR